MKTLDDPFATLTFELDQTGGEFSALSRRPVRPTGSPVAGAAPATARFHGFDLDDAPLVVGVPGLPQEIVAARSTVPLRRSDIGSTVVLLFEDGEPRRPIVVGVLQSADRAGLEGRPVAPTVSVQADDDRYVIDAEREIVLRCGDASITLTRAGKVIIKGTHIVSRSSGYNKIKGAAVDIN